MYKHVDFVGKPNTYFLLGNRTCYSFSISLGPSFLVYMELVFQQESDLEV